MRVLISGGGTGGHVYPALSVVAQLPRVSGELQQDDEHRDWRLETEAQSPVSNLQSPISNLLWVGSTGRMEQTLVERAGIPFRGIDTGQIRGINPVSAVVNVGKMITGVRQSLALLDEFRPDVCFVTGGYVCAPVAVACRLRGIPVLIYLPDIVPGWAIRALGRLAQRVAVTFPAAAHYFGGEVPQGKAVVTGYPVREELVTLTGGAQASTEEHRQRRACARQQLAERLQRPLQTPGTNGSLLPLTLVWGASQGSRNINQALWRILPEVLAKTHVLHIVGERDWPLFQEQKSVNSLPAELRERYHPVAYLHDEMALALAAADLTVARAGASSLGEFPVARLPAILVPLLGVNQLQNAEQLTAHNAAVIVDDDGLAEKLPPILLELIDNVEKRQRMETALAGLAQPGAALKIAEELKALSVARM